MNKTDAIHKIFSRLYRSNAMIKLRCVVNNPDLEAKISELTREEIEWNIARAMSRVIIRESIWRSIMYGAMKNNKS